ncbi:MAG TPA: tetratricopeptide repeat protein, partial [Mycobacteriales bacterium]|nr:tetratricopeptide repeat protein [Mycobacteriales bacterium]
RPMKPTDISLPGAVPLGAPKPAPAAAPPGGSAAGPGRGAAVVDVSEATFQTEVLDRSREVPIVIDFWASWCGPCKQLSPVLERLATESGGRWVLAKVDVDANPQLSAALRIQSIPTVMVALGGQLAPGFAGALPEAHLRQFLDQVLEAAQQLGLTGAAAGEGPPEEPPVDPGILAAEEALDRGDFEAATEAYRTVLAASPGDELAKTGLAQVELIRRTTGADERAARRAADERPDDVDAQCRVADLDVVAGSVDEAFARLVDLVRRTGGSDRDRVRTHLLGLFDVIGGDDPRVLKARRALASALF